MKKFVFLFAACVIAAVAVFFLLSNPVFQYGTWRYSGNLHGTYQDKHNHFSNLTIDLEEEKYYYYVGENQDQGNLSGTESGGCMFTSGKLEGAVITRQAKGNILLSRDGEAYYFYKISDVPTVIGTD